MPASQTTPRRAKPAWKCFAMPSLEKVQMMDVHWASRAAACYEPPPGRARAKVLAIAAGFPHKRYAFDVRLNPAAEQPAIHNNKTAVEDTTVNLWQQSERWIFNKPCRARRWRLL